MAWDAVDRGEGGMGQVWRGRRLGKGWRDKRTGKGRGQCSGGMEQQNGKAGLGGPGK